jgi:LppP/LprE lipoprotein
MGVMRRNLIGALAALALGIGAGAILGGCGGSETKTVSVAGAPEVTQSTATAATITTSTTHTSTTSATTTNTATAPTSTAGGTAAPGATHTAPEPEFTQQEAHGEGAREAVDTLKAHGYTPVEPAQYHANQTLRVLVGTRAGSSDGYGQQAFFFVAGRYIGTDTKEPSATVKVIAQSDTEVTLGYPLYRNGDPLSNPSGGQATVRFQLNNGKLVALDPIPPASSTTGTSRN